MSIFRDVARASGLGHLKRSMARSLRFSPPSQKTIVLPDRRRSTPSRYLSIVSVFKNEAPYLAEWLEFHRIVGVEHIYLYDNGSEDNSGGVLRPFVEEGFVTVTPWPFPWIMPGSPPTQMLAFAHALLTFGHDWRWMAFIDVDEFLFPVEGSSLSVLLSRYEDLPALATFWTMFGFSNHDAPPPGLVIENYTMRAPFPTYARPKSIVDPVKVRAVHSAHAFDLDEGHLSFFNEERKLFRKDDPLALVSNIFRLNHYYTRSRQELELKIVNRQLAKGRRGKLRAIVDLVEAAPVYDKTILRFLPSLKQRLGGYQG